MLTHFSAKNFRCFQDWVHFDLTTDKRYEFSEHAVQDGIIRHGMVYGHNGGGKTNLGYALMDAANHLSTRGFTTGPSTDTGYLNGDSDSDIAEFHFRFLFDGCQVDYEYQKTAPEELCWEKLSFDGEIIIEWNKAELTPATINLEGAETLNRALTDNIISAISYVDKNSVLPTTKKTLTFIRFFSFVTRMAFLKTNEESDLRLDSTNRFQHFNNWILEKGGVENFQVFLNQAGIDCQLGVANSLEGKRLVLQYNNAQLDFMNHASSGTVSMAALYFWLDAILDGVYTFVYIDEFDVYYHHALAQTIARKVFESDSQVILTTHNTSIMSNDLLRPDCYFTVERDKILPVYKQSDRELRKAHNLEKMYRAGAFNDQ